LQISEEGGSLEITVPLTDDEFLRESLVLTAFQNGIFVPGAALSRWSYDQGQSRDRVEGPWRIPNMAPGEYRVCLLPRQLQAFLPGGYVPEGAACDSGLLAPGATLALKPARPK
jgi:hypothetical protein